MVAKRLKTATVTRRRGRHCGARWRGLPRGTPCGALPWNGSWNEIEATGGNSGLDGPLIAGNAGDGGHDDPLNRPPEAGAQVRILPGAPTAGGARISGSSNASMGVVTGCE
jgi:hypothetical protein